VWALQGWRDKLAAGFTHSAALSGDKLGTLTQLAVFAAQHGMVWVGLGLPPTYAGLGETDDTNRLGRHLGAMAQSRPGGGAVPESDLRTAEHLGRRVAEAALRWGTTERTLSTRHSTTATWAFPPPDRAAPPDGIERTNLRELVARPERFEHHLVVCASIGAVQLEITAASEPCTSAILNIPDEYALALPTGDDLVDCMPRDVRLRSCDRRRSRPLQPSDRRSRAHPVGRRTRPATTPHTSRPTSRPGTGTGCRSSIARAPDARGRVPGAARRRSHRRRQVVQPTPPRMGSRRCANAAA
jgi:hypothetical protein